MPNEKPVCLACGGPAATGGPAPLCAQCSALAKKNQRGVKFEKAAERPPETLRTGEPPR
jgi:hypothetical protein